MRRTILTVFLTLVAVPAIAQGLVNFVNTPTTLVSAEEWMQPPTASAISGPPGSYYFGLLTSTSGIFNFTFSGVFATNESIAGRLSGGMGVAVPGWAPGTTRNFEIVGWSADLGHDFNPRWMAGDFPYGVVGQSPWGTGIAGGFDGTELIPALDLFAPPMQGFTLAFSGFPVPEPFACRLVLIGLVTAAFSRWRP